MKETLELSPAQIRALTRIRRLAWLLDRSIGVPGTRFRLGLDAILGLIPGVGDGASALLGGAIIVQSMQFKLPLWVRAKMLINLAVDAVIGVVPVLGDLLDIGFQANQRNVQLLLDTLDDSTQREASPAALHTQFQKALAVVLVALTVALLLGVMILPVWLLSRLF